MPLTTAAVAFIVLYDREINEVPKSVNFYVEASY